MQGAALGVPDQARLVPDPDDAAVLADHAVLGLEGLAGPVGALVLLQHPPAVLGVEQPVPELGVLQELLRVVAEHLPHVRAAVDGPVVVVDAVQVHDGRDLLDEQPVPPLGPLQPLLGLPALRDIKHDALAVGWAALDAGQDDRAVADPHHPPVAGYHPVLHVEGLAGPVAAVVGLQHAPAVLGVQALDPQPRVRHPLLCGEAEHPLDLGADVDRGAHPVELVYVRDGGYLLHERAEPLLGLPQPVLGPLAPCDVLVQRDEVAGLAPRVPHEGDARQGPHHAPVLADEALLLGLHPGVGLEDSPRPGRALASFIGVRDPQ